MTPSMAPGSGDRSPTRRIASGAAWLYGSRWLERIIDFLSLVVLARLLSPDDFGLVAIAASVVTIIEGLSAFDVNKALIRHRDESRSLYDTAWTLGALRGFIAAATMIVISRFVGDPDLAAILLVLSLGPIFTGLANPRFIMFERALIYSRMASVLVSARMIAFVVTIAVALVTRSYWALVAGMLVGIAASTVLGYLLRPYGPRATLSRWRDLFAFSGWLSLSTAVTTLTMETDKIIVGRLLGLGEAGYYFMTQRIGVLPTRELVSPLQRILFPSFSELSTEPKRFRGAVLESVNAMGTLSLPAGFGFALVADEFVPLALGAQWTVIVPLLVTLVPYLGIRATLTLAVPCAMAMGRTRLLFAVNLVYAFIHLPLFIGGTALYGLRGAIGGIVVAGVFFTGLNAYLLHRTAGLAPRDLWGQLRRPFIAALIMVVAVLGLDRWVFPDGTEGVAAWLSLFATVGAGVVVYAAALAGLWSMAGRPPGLERRLLELVGR